MDSQSVFRRFVMLILLVGTLLLAASPVASRPLPSITSSAPSTQPFLRWVSLGKPSGGYALGLPVVGYNQDGRIELFALGSNDHIWHIFQTAPNGGWSTGWDEFAGGDCHCAAVGENLDGRMELFTLWYDLAIWHTSQGVPNGPFVSGWQPFGWPANGVSVSCPRVNRNQDGRLEVFTTGSDGNVWSMPQVSPSDGWGSWVNLGNPGRWISSLAMGHDQDGRLFFFVVGDDNAIYFRWQSAINDGWDPNWWRMGQPSGVSLYAPAVGRNPDGRQELFAVGDDGNLWHRWQVAPNAGWSDWESLGKPPSGLKKSYREPVVGYNQDGTMEVFAPSYDSSLWHIGQIAPGDGWGGWASLGLPPVGLLDQDRAVGQQQNGRLLVFAAGADGAIWLDMTGTKVYLPLVVKNQH